MSLAVAARIARRELRGGLGGFRVLIACVALGVAAIAGVGSMRASIEAGLAREGAALLGGDAEIQLTYRFADPSELEWMQGVAGDVSEVVDFRSMAVTGAGEAEDRALTQVKAVDDKYPLYGAVTLSPAMPLDQALDGADGVPGAVAEQALIYRLGIAPGDRFALGDQEFVLMASLARAPDSGAGGFALGPTSIVRRAALEPSGLLAPGTLFESAYRLKLPPGSDLDALHETADGVIGEGYRWRDARNGAPGIANFVENLGAFLVLVGLSGLAVGGVGVAAALRAYLDRKTSVIATLKTLGAERRTIFATYLFQVAALTAVGIAIGLVLGALVPFLVVPLIGAAIPVPAVAALYPGALAEAGFYGLLMAAIFSLWPLARAQNLRAATLYREEGLGARGWPGGVWVLVIALLVAVLVGSAAWLTGEMRLALGAAVGIIGAFAILVAAAALLRRMTRWLSHLAVFRGRPVLRLALASVGGPGGETMSVMLSLGLGLSVLAAVGQVDANLRGAIQRDLPAVAPAYFVVDIQQDQIDSFRTAVLATEGVTQLESAPMLRGVITRINDQPARDVSDHWVVRGDRGITYSAAPPPNAKVTAGTWWPEGYTGPPQISFAAEEAQEMGLTLGDMLTVNVLGRDITGEITSFREVDFSSAGMGFVLSMDPGALQGAPHSFIATIYGGPGPTNAVIRTVSREMPNITAISVSDAIAQVSVLLAGIATATALGAGATLLTGAVVLIGAAAAGETARRYEAAVLKSVGASRWQVAASLGLRSALVGVLAGLVAIGAGALGAWAVVHFVMQVDFIFAPLSALSIVGAGLILTLLTGLGFTLRALAVQPARLLRADG